MDQINAKTGERVEKVTRDFAREVRDCAKALVEHVRSHVGVEVDVDSWVCSWGLGPKHTGRVVERFFELEPKAELASGNSQDWVVLPEDEGEDD